MGCPLQVIPFDYDWGLFKGKTLCYRGAFWPPDGISHVAKQDGAATRAHCLGRWLCDQQTVTASPWRVSACTVVHQCALSCMCHVLPEGSGEYCYLHYSSSQKCCPLTGFGALPLAGRFVL